MAYYPLNGSAEDASGNNHHGILFGPVPTEDQGGTANAALYFDGVNDYVQLPSAEEVLANTNPDAWSITGRFKLENDHDPLQMDIISDYDSRIHAGIYDLFYGFAVSVHRQDDFALSASLRHTTDSRYTHTMVSSGSVTWNAWTSFAMVVSKPEEKAKLYINGVLVTEIGISPDADYIEPTPIVIGTGGFFDGRFVAFTKGSIDEVRIYDRALSSEEVLEIALNEGLVAYYPFNGNAQDATGNGHDGIAYGATLSDDSAGNPIGAYSFDGVDDYIELGDVTQMLGEDPVEWSYTLDFLAPTSQEAILINDYIGGPDYYFGIYLRLMGASQGNRFMVSARHGNYPDTPEFLSDEDKPYTPGTWHSVAVTASKNIGLLRFFIDGELAGETELPAISTYFNFDLVSLGRQIYQGAPQHLFDGSIDEVRIYDRALSEAEILTLAGSRTQDKLQWPTRPFEGLPVVTQDHSCRGRTILLTGTLDDSCVSQENHHAGLDVVPTGSETGVYAAGAGTVTAAVTDCGEDDSSCNSGYGNSLIIQHDADLYTLYAHLAPDSVEVTSDTVEAGQKLAEMGSTGNVTGPHLHFEVKTHGGLKDSTNTYAAYTPAHPNSYGYLDPWTQIRSTSFAAVPIEITNTEGVYVRRGPASPDYSALTEVAQNQRFVGFAKHIDGSDTWYRIHLPCGNGNSCAGWIAGVAGGITYAELRPSAMAIEVSGSGTSGMNVRVAPGGSKLDKVYDGQQFVFAGTLPPDNDCSSPWYQIDLPAVSGAETGWICGDYARPVGSAEGTVLSAGGTVRLRSDTLDGVSLNLSGTASATTTSGPNGAYDFSDLGSGSYALTPSLAGHVFDPPSRAVTLAGAPQTGLDFRACNTTAPLTGTVISGLTGDAALGATVSVDGVPATTVTNPDGSFSIPGIGCGRFDIGVSYADYASRLFSVDRFTQSHVDIQLTQEPTTNGVAHNAGMISDPVNTATGNYIYQHRDLELPGIGMPLRFDRAYNSREASSTGAAGAPLGYGWTHSYHVRLAEDSGGIVTITWGDGHTETFTPDGSGGYTPQYGVFDTLTDNGDGTFRLEKRDRTLYDFDTSGRLVAITDKNGNSLTLAYTGANLTEITDTAGRVIMLDYDVSGRLVLITDPIGRTVQYGYDANGDLIEATDPNGNLTQYTYDGEHQILTVVDPRGHTIVNNTYDDRRVVTYQTDAKGNPTEFAYQELDRITTITDALGNVTVHQHDELLRLIREEDARGGVALYEYDSAGNRVQVTDKNGNITQYQYDARGNVTRKTDALGNTTEITYDTDDNPLTRTDALGNVTQFSYDANGNLTQTEDALGNASTITYLPNGLPETITDPNGHTTTNAYDASGNLVQVTDALGNTTSYTYDGVGRRLTETDALGRETTYGYDANDNVLTVTDALGNSVSHGYDANDNKLSTTDRLGRTTQWAYDEKDLLISETDPAGNAVTYTYGPLDRRLSRTDRRGNTTQYAFDAVGNRIEMTDALGNVTSYAYDLNGNQVRRTDANGHSTTTRYDALNRRTEVQDALGNAVVTAYDALGRVVTVTAPGGRVTQNSYDALGRLTQTADPEGGSTQFGYDANGNRISRTDANGHTTTTSYDALNRVVAVTDPLGHSTQLTFDAVGNRISTTDALGHTAETAYDALNRPVSQTDALGQSETTTYDAEGNVLSTTDANGETTSFGYDVLDRLTLVTDAEGGTVQYSYDENGNRLSMTDPNGNVTTYAYDALNRRTTMTEPLGHVTSLVYDAVGNLIQKTDPKGQVIGYSYDAVNRRTGIDYPAQPDVSFDFDAVGNPIGMTDGLGTTTHVYDRLDRRTSTTDPFGQQVGYGYDPVGNRVSLTYPGAKTVTYAYDAANRLTTVTDWLGNQTSYSHDAANRLSGATNANGTTAAYGYDAADRLIGLTNAKSDASVINAYSYTLDPIGNHLSEDRTEPLSPQLAAETVTDTHDAENRLIESDGVTNSFDANGNLTAKGSDTYAYDAADRLIETNIAGTETQYQYDALGNRYSRTRDGIETRFVLDTNTTLTNVLMETDGAGTPLAYNVYGQGLISRILPDDSVLTYHYDSRGSTIAMTDAAGNVVQEYAYDPFGRVANTDGSAANPFGFLGRHGVLDEGDDLSFIRARYYDAGLQRFVNKDKLLVVSDQTQVLNRYIYGRSNPVVLVDVNGYFSFKRATTGFSMAMTGLLQLTAGAAGEVLAPALGTAYSASRGNTVATVTGFAATYDGVNEASKQFSAGFSNIFHGNYHAIAAFFTDTDVKYYDAVKFVQDYEGQGILDQTLYKDHPSIGAAIKGAAAPNTFLSLGSLSDPASIGTGPEAALFAAETAKTAITCFMMDTCQPTEQLKDSVRFLEDALGTGRVSSFTTRSRPVDTPSLLATPFASEGFPDDDPPQPSNHPYIPEVVEVQPSVSVRRDK